MHSIFSVDEKRICEELYSAMGDQWRLRMTKRGDEQTKLLANLLNATAGTCITTGLITPIVAIFFNFGNSASDIPLWKIIFSSMAFTVAAIVLHRWGRRVLEKHSE